MLTLHRPGSGPWHRLPAGRKSVLLMMLVLGLCLLPTSRTSAAITAIVCAACFAVPGVGLREIGRASGRERV